MANLPLNQDVAPETRPDIHPIWQKKIPPWAAFLGALAGAGFGLALLQAFSPADPAPPARRQGAPDPAGGQEEARSFVRPPLPPGSYPPDPLPVGARALPFEAAGWLNGQPPVVDRQGARLIVLDIWSMW